MLIITVTATKRRITTRTQAISAPMDPSERNPVVRVAESFFFQVLNMIPMTTSQITQGPQVARINKITGITATPGMGMNAQMMVISQSGNVIMMHTNEVTYKAIEVTRAHWMGFS